MTAATAPAVTRPNAGPRRRGLATARLLRLELCHNAMLWIVPVAIGVFWFVSYRKIMALPPLWYLRTTAFHTGIVANFIVPVVGAAAWMGSREARRRVTDLTTIAARPRWSRLLVTWAATGAWALVGYLVCLAVVYSVTAHQASWGGPLWWPAAVAAASVLAFSALGFAAGTLLPSRFTAPLVAVAAFFLLVLSTELITGSQSYWQISPVVAGPWDDVGDPGVATFYPYVRDLSIAQIMFLAGLTVAVLGAVAALGSGRGARIVAGAVAAAGLLAAGTGVGLAGTGRMDSHGMITIAALHDAGSDRPIRYTPVCSHGAIPVCLNPAYASYLPAVATALRPVLSEIAGLPGAPVQVVQAAASYQQESGNGINEYLAGGPVSGLEFRLLLPDQLPAPQLTIGQLATQVRNTDTAAIAASLVGYRPGGSQAQQAVAMALTMDAGAPWPTSAGPPGPSGRVEHGRCGHRTAACGSVTAPVKSSTVYVVARRFAALPAATRRAWLARHLAALRAGQIEIAQLP